MIDQRARPASPRRCSSAIFASSSSITSGSRSVVTSPSARPSAMSRRRRRMILPERVFGRSSAQMIRFGRANLPIRSATTARISSTSSSLGSVSPCEGDEGADRLAGVLVGLADHRRLGDLLVGDDRRLDLGRREPVAGDVDDVVDAADHPEVAVLVAAGGVADQVGLLAEASRSRSRRSGPPPCRGCAASTARAGVRTSRPWPLLDRLAVALVDHLGLDPGKRLRRRAGLGRGDPRQRRDHDRAGLGLPPGVDDRAAFAADHLVVPEPGLRVDRLADRAEQAQRGEVVLGRDARPPT